MGTLGSNVEIWDTPSRHPAKTPNRKHQSHIALPPAISLLVYRSGGTEIAIQPRRAVSIATCLRDHFQDHAHSRQEIANENERSKD